tara:strand:- start:4301 stop:5506 length:1206 start_codon:yes stop_codon:yes gene_type:complete
MNENLQKKCLCCSSFKIKKILKLTDSPLTDSYSKSKETSLKKTLYPLELFYCEECTHLQLGFQVSPTESYKDYLYNSKITPGLVNSFKEYAEILISRNSKKEELNILDIGSNDGTFLEACKNVGCKAIGVEPAEVVAKYANKHGRKTINAYLDKNLSNLLKQEEICAKFDYITFNNVLANIGNPIEALEIAKTMLKSKESEIVVQTGYHPLQFSKGLFDYIYHEHFSYFNINSMKRLCMQVGLKVAHYKISNLRGGTIRFFLQKGYENENKINNNLERFSKAVELKGLEILIDSSRSHLKSNLDNLKNKKYKIIGFGASHSTGVLVKHFGLEKYLDYLVDENIDKHGLYMPGTSLQVKDCGVIYKEKNLIILILAWQYFDLIREKLISNGFEGQILKPMLP